MENLYIKESLTFYEIIFLLNHEYDPDKKLVLQLLKLITQKIYNLNQQFLVNDIIAKKINNYNIQNNEQYLEYAFKIRLHELIELFINNRAKVSDYSLSEALKYYYFDDVNYLNLMLKYKLVDIENKKYKFIKEITENKKLSDNSIIGIFTINCNDIIEHLIQKYKNWNWCLSYACESGNKKYIEHAIQNGANDYNLGLKHACKGGYMDVIEYLISKGANDYNLGLFGACQGGHLNVVEFMIYKGANNWDLGLEGACQGGHRELVEFMISKGAKNWNWGLKYACESGNKDIINLLISKGANCWNLGLYGASLGGHKDIIDFMISKGATYVNWGLEGACQGGHRELVEFMISKGADDWKWGLKYAYQHGHKDIIDCLKNKFEC
ncbi:MAG: ankyrin repeat domain-containing protein [Candidatus Micrarchaeaceae archaeon]